MVVSSAHTQLVWEPMVDSAMADSAMVLVLVMVMVSLPHWLMVVWAMLPHWLMAVSAMVVWAMVATTRSKHFNLFYLE